MFLLKYRILQAKDVARTGIVHPESGGILTLHRPLYPPGRILHLVRHHPGHTQFVTLFFNILFTHFIY